MQFVCEHQSRQSSKGSRGDSIRVGPPGQLLQQEPWLRSKGGEGLLLRHSSVVELLEMDFYQAIDQGDPKRAWANLKTLSQYWKLDAIVIPDHEQWYSRLFDQYQAWALCKNQRHSCWMNRSTSSGDIFHRSNRNACWNTSISSRISTDWRSQSKFLVSRKHPGRDH